MNIEEEAAGPGDRDEEGAEEEVGEGAGAGAEAGTGEVEEVDVQQATQSLGTCIHTQKYTYTCRYTHIPNMKTIMYIHSPIQTHPHHVIQTRKQTREYSKSRGWCL